MNLKFYLEKLYASENYKKFIKENPDAFLCSGFFTIDKVGEDNQQHFDFYISSPKLPAHSDSQINEKIVNKKSSQKSVKLIGSIKSERSEDKLNKKIFSFQLENDCRIVPIEIFDNKIPEKLNKNIDFNFEKIEKIVLNKIQKEDIKNKIQKIILSLQNINGKDFLVGTIFTSGLGMIKINIDIKEMKITDFEKKSFFDMLKIIRKK